MEAFVLLFLVIIIFALLKISSYVLEIRDILRKRTQVPPYHSEFDSETSQD